MTITIYHLERTVNLGTNAPIRYSHAEVFEGTREEYLNNEEFRSLFTFTEPTTGTAISQEFVELITNYNITHHLTGGGGSEVEPIGDTILSEIINVGDTIWLGENPIFIERDREYFNHILYKSTPEEAQFYYQNAGMPNLLVSREKPFDVSVADLYTWMKNIISSFKTIYHIRKNLAEGSEDIIPDSETLDLTDNTQQRPCVESFGEGYGILSGDSEDRIAIVNTLFNNGEYPAVIIHKLFGLDSRIQSFYVDIINTGREGGIVEKQTQPLEEVVAVMHFFRALIKELFLESNSNLLFLSLLIADKGIMKGKPVEIRHPTIRGLTPYTFDKSAKTEDIIDGLLHVDSVFSRITEKVPLAPEKILEGLDRLHARGLPVQDVTDLGLREIINPTTTQG